MHRCIQSVLEQTYDKYELLLIDDGSRDKSYDMCDEYAGQYSNIKVEHTKNRGVSSARNTGIEIASGEYVFFLDSDDSIKNDELERYASIIAESGRDIIIGGMLVLDEDGRTHNDCFESCIELGQEIWERICYDPRRFGYAGAKMVKTSILREYGIRFNTQMNSQEDLDFFVSVYPYCNDIYVSDYPGYCYYYTQGKREPRFWDYIAVNIKILRIAESKISLSNEAGSCVRERIVSFLYTALYFGVENDQFDYMVNMLNQVDGLTEVVSATAADSIKVIIAKCFVTGKYLAIKRYFLCRNLARGVFRKVKGIVNKVR